MSSVSFVSTFYNKEKYVDIVLEYIRRQNRITNAEYIFVDDGSTDRTLEKLRQKEHSFDNVKIISIENSGPAIATNVGLAEVSKEYVKLVDGDDILHPDATVRLTSSRTSGTSASSPYWKDTFSRTAAGGRSLTAGTPGSSRRPPAGWRPRLSQADR